MRRWIGPLALIALVLVGSAAGLSRASASHLALTGGVLQEFSFPGPGDAFTPVPSPSETAIDGVATQAPVSPEQTPVTTPFDVAPTPSAGPAEASPAPTPTSSIDPTLQPGELADSTPTASSP